MSPVNQRSDFILGGKPFMLVRPGPGRGRAWHRGGQPDVPSHRGRPDYGQLPAELNVKFVWDDFSGGYGDYYRDEGRPNAIHYSENMDTRFPKQVFHCQELTVPAARYASITSYPRFMIEVPFPSGAATGNMRATPGMGHLLILGTNYMGHYIPSALNLNGSQFSGSGMDMSSGVGTLGNRPAIFGSFGYIPAASGNFEEYNVQTIDRVNYLGGTWLAQGFAVAGGKLWRYHSGYMIQSVAAGASPYVAGNWSATLVIGNGEMSINDMIGFRDQLFIGMPDGLYAGDLSGTFLNVLGGGVLQRHEENGRDLAAFAGGVAMPAADGVWWYRPSDYVAEARQLGPQRRSNRSPVRGRIRSLYAHADWLYAGMWTGSNSYLLASQLKDDGMPSDKWNVLQRLPHDTKVSRIYIDSITAGTGAGVTNPQSIPQRMWVLTDESMPGVGTSTTYYSFIPAQNGPPMAFDVAFSANYVGSGRMDLGAVDYKGVPMIYKSVEVWADNLLSGWRYCDVYYTLDEGTRTLLGRAQTSPMTRVYFPEVGASIFVAGRSMALSIESFTAATQHPLGTQSWRGQSQIYRAFVLNASLRPRPAEVVTAVVRIADGIRDRSGAPMRKGAAMISDLRSFADPTRDGGSAQKLIDLAGATSWVAVLAPVEEEEYYQKGEESPEIAATVKLAVLEFSGQV